MSHNTRYVNYTQAPIKPFSGMLVWQLLFGICDLRGFRNYLVSYEDIKHVVDGLDFIRIAWLRAVCLESVSEVGSIDALVCIRNNFGKRLNIIGRRGLGVSNLGIELCGRRAALGHDLLGIGAHIGVREVVPARGERT